MNLSTCGIRLIQGNLLEITKKGITRIWQLPSFPLSEGMAEAADLLDTKEVPFKNGTEAILTFSLTNTKGLLKVIIQTRPDTDILRMKYVLDGEDQFKGIDEEDHIFYGGMQIVSTGITELQISQFDRILHSFVPTLTHFTAEECEGVGFVGPILIAEDEMGLVFGAYEHGAQAPDHFLEWNRDEKGIWLSSVKGNYFDGQKIADYAAPWLEIGFASCEEELFKKYRTFMMEDMCLYGDSRKPYVFFNTWHNQEGKKYFVNDSYLKYLNDDFVLRDIDIAHEMGVEVYVIDTGWFQKTGDWEVNQDFFPCDLKKVRERLDQYGMKLGLWFNPIAASRTSEMYVKHPECVMNWQGEETYWGKIWETEESYGMCLVSDYSDMFIERLCQLNKSLGVVYFKWDAVGQYGCDSLDHNHGDAHNSPKERADAYAYRMGLEMIRIAQEVSRRCPGAIVDFDVTEGGRFVGLGFLSAGKYFLINNGPYFKNFDIPETVKMEPDTINVFFYPGPARPQICRQAAKYDPYIPSVLFLTHFFPHGGELGQRNSMAAFALGGNGIWGFLQEMKQEDIARWSIFLEKYKRVREDITLAYPLQKGNQGGSPEIHEKLNVANGRGAVIFFTHGGGSFTHITQPLDILPTEVDGADEVTYLDNNRVRIRVNLDTDEARVVFFY